MYVQVWCFLGVFCLSFVSGECWSGAVENCLLLIQFDFQVQSALSTLILCSHYSVTDLCRVVAVQKDSWSVLWAET